MCPNLKTCFTNKVQYVRVQCTLYIVYNLKRCCKCLECSVSGIKMKPHVTFFSKTVGINVKELLTLWLESERHRCRLLPARLVLRLLGRDGDRVVVHGGQPLAQCLVQPEEQVPGDTEESE